ncbi:2-oxoacid:acceptor oxidoreductase subunit alpha, partial [candidate division KSB1 bacterium]
NIKAAEEGQKIGIEICKSCEILIEKNPDLKNNIITTGTEGVSLGAMAGGCNFISTYPMSPGTGVLTFLANQTKDFDIIAELAEDEISAINMAVASWYAGARGMVTTSGGGFALMVEAISLSGMIETPVVVHIGQRPGPATGLPTRTEQGDLELALYAGHGEFPRIILAPGDPEQAFYLSQKAFIFADKFQSPVIILTDQYLLDSYFSVKDLDPELYKNEYFIVKTDKDYKRYKLTDNGISPRGIPGYGEGLVRADSDEHDEEGHITEDFEVRNSMVHKRQRKLETITNEVIEPELIGSENYKTLIIGWGTTYHVIKEALLKQGRDDVSFLHFQQVYPLHPDTLKYLEKAEKTVIIENNASSQFAKLIRLKTGFDIEHKILKYNGLQFYVDEILEGLKEINI